MRGNLLLRLGGLLGSAWLVACAAKDTTVDDDFTEHFQLQRAALAAQGRLAPSNSDKPIESSNEWVHRYLVLEGPAAAEIAPRELNSPDVHARRRARLLEIQEQQDKLILLIKAIGAKISYRYQRLANAIQITAPIHSLEALARLPGVIRLDTVILHDRRLKSAVPFIGGYKAWSAQGATIHGEGIRIGIVDTGVDYTHTAFDGVGTPEAYKANDPTEIEPGSFPTTKVIGGTDFVGEYYDASKSGSSPVPDGDPLDCQGLQGMAITGGHGTHVASIAAGLGVLNNGTTFPGPYDQSLSPSQFRVGPGVAPKASLYALKVFGCEGSTAMSNAALEWAADPNEDGDFSDRLDVLNLSLGGSYGLASSTEQSIIKNITDLGALLVIAAGNEGNAFYVTGWPSTATEALSVAATTDAISFQALTVLSPAAIAGEKACLEGSFTKPLSLTGAIEGPLAYANPPLACSSLTNPSEIAGKIAFIDRGTCTFVTKITNALNAGAIAVVVADKEDSDVPFAMGGDGTEVDIPGVMIRKIDGDAIRAQLKQGVSIQMTPGKEFVTTLSADQIAGFSSRGPRTLDNALKPDLGAPGVAIDAAGVGTGTGPRQLQGTSMACPMVAGAAALVRQANPTFSPAEVKAALMNSAAPGKGPEGEPVPVSLMGAGRVQADRALDSPFTAAVSEPPGAVGISFGALIVSQTTLEKRSVTVTNHGDSEITLQAEAVLSYDLPGVTLEVSPATLVVPAKSTASVDLTLTVDPTLLPPEQPDPLTPAQAPYVNQPRHFLTEAGGHLRFSSGGREAQVPFHAVVRAASEVKVDLHPSCEPPSTSIFLPLTGESAHKNPVTTAFELGAKSPKKGSSSFPKMGDLLAVGVANNLPNAESFEKASLYFGVVVNGPWTTPAMGSQSVVGVYIDTNDDKKPDYAVLAEPLRRDPPYFDVLTAATYNLKTGQQGQPRFLNIFPRDQVDTQPFNNSVLVMPVTLSSIGLKAGKARFNYRGFSELSFPLLASDATPWATYDLDAVAIDTAVGGREGRPLYEGMGPIEVRLGASSQPGNLPKVLLLHHTNIADQRYEIVDLNLLVSKEEADLKIDLVGNIPGGSLATAKVVNQGPGVAKNVWVQFDLLSGNSITKAIPSVGTCTAGLQKECHLGDLAPGMEASLSLGFQAKGKLQVKATVSSESCDTMVDNNTAELLSEGGTGSGGAAGGGGKGTGWSAGVSGASGYDLEWPTYETEGLTVGGGCDCGVVPRNRENEGGAEFLLGILGFIAVKKRREAR